MFPQRKIHKRGFRAPVEGVNVEKRVLLVIVLVIIFGLVSFCAAFGFIGNWLIESAYNGQSLNFLNELVRKHRIQNPAQRDLEHYLTLGRLLFSRVFITGLAMSLASIALLFRRETLATVKQFFTAATHPINLAVFRIIFFWTLFSSVDTSYAAWFGQVPPELRVAPAGLGWMLRYVPIDETWVTFSCYLLRGLCVTGMIGLFSRSSALLAAILGFYVHGIPSFFGKVNHDHHLVWFSVILAVSRCGDMFSCDAVRAAWKRADVGVTDPPGPSRVYALPLRFVWILLGVLYFFPGFWKLWSSGFDWAFSDNLKLRMYLKWMEFNDWTPFFRLDHYPALYKPAALGTMFFELSFIFLIFFPQVRILAPLGGILFHSMSSLFLRIFFLDVIRCYVAFFDWNAIFHRLGQFLYKQDMTVIYDGSCKLCRRTIASLRMFDVFGRVNYTESMDKLTLSVCGLRSPAAHMPPAHILAFGAGKNWAGFSAYRALARRIPLLWPVLPLLYVWPIPTIGNRIYRQVAGARTCWVGNRIALDRSEHKRQYLLSPIIMVGTILVTANIFCGVSRVTNSWPFACYPIFDRVTNAETQDIQIQAVTPSGENHPLESWTLSDKFSHERWAGLIRQIVSTHDPEQLRVRLLAFWRLWEQNHLEYQRPDSLRFYKITLSTVPELRGKNPIRRELLFEAYI